MEAEQYIRSYEELLEEGEAHEFGITQRKDDHSKVAGSFVKANLTPSGEVENTQG